MKQAWLGRILVLLVFFSCSRPDSETAKRNAPLFGTLGTHHHPVTTSSELAQKYFDQGVILAYGFNHKEAERSFREAVAIDPQCAMAYWGIALVLGPNINAPMDDEAIPGAWEAIQTAVRLSPSAGKKEQAYIHALAKRYTDSVVADRTLLNTAYANAMRELAANYPDDPDATTLFADALMNLSPWNYWTREGTPYPQTVELLSALEGVMERTPDHPGANHLYIHAVEASRNPERGVGAADRLRTLVPGAGHLVHMPAHIYMRVGRYHDASTANQRADSVDDAYITACKVQGLYPLAYHPHNNHFLAMSASMEGRSKEALRAARKTASQADKEKMCAPGFGTLQHYSIIPIYVLTRFGRWKEILQEPKPADRHVYPVGVWHYARGLAYARTGKLDSARNELRALDACARDTASLKDVTIWDINTSMALLGIGSELLKGEIFAREKSYARSFAHLQKAVVMEDQLNYDEPPPWFYPPRHSLGSVYLEAGRAAEAEAVFRADLKKHPHNGWGLKGLEQSLRAQGKSSEADATLGQFHQAWAHADVQITLSRF